MYSKTLYDWLFHYNPFTHKWDSFKREDYLAYFNGQIKPVSSSNIEALIELIGKTDGDSEKIEQLIKKQP